MSQERANNAQLNEYETLEAQRLQIMDDLLRINQARIAGFSPETAESVRENGFETDMGKVLDSLEAIAEPHHILSADDGDYIVGDIRRHEELFVDLINSRMERGLPRIRSMNDGLVSGMGFTLQTNTNFKYAVLDQDPKQLQDLPPRAVTLVEAGYVIVDRGLRQIKKD